MKMCHETTCLPFQDTIPKRYDIAKIDYLKYICQAFNSTCEKICVVNVRFIYFNDDGKPDIYIIFKIYILFYI